MIDEEERVRRYESYLQGGTIQEMADRIGLTRSGYISWLWRNGLPIRERQKEELRIQRRQEREEREENKRKKRTAYIETRPSEERQQMRKFFNSLMRAVGYVPEDCELDVRNYIECYRETNRIR